MVQVQRLPRRSLLKAGEIVFRGGRATCAIKNLSKTGACLIVSKAVPDMFHLVIEMEHTKRLCEVIWREPGTVGVHFKGTN